METLRKLVVGAATTIGVIGAVVTLNLAYQKYQTTQTNQTTQTTAPTEKKEAVEDKSIQLKPTKQEEVEKRLSLLPQGTFWNRTEICHFLLFKRMQRCCWFTMGERSDYNGLLWLTNIQVAKDTFSNWNLSDGTFEIQFKDKKFHHRLFSLNQNSIRIIRSGSEIGENNENVFYPQEIFLQGGVKEWDRITGKSWNVDLLELMDPAKTTMAEFQEIFNAPKSISQSTSGVETSGVENDRVNLVNLVKMADKEVDDASQLPTVLRQLTMDYAN